MQKHNKYDAMSNIVYNISFSCVMLLVLLQAGAQTSPKEMQKLVDENLKLAVSQYKYMQKILPHDKLPRSYDSVKNELITSGITMPIIFQTLIVIHLQRLLCVLHYLSWLNTPTKG